MHPVIFKFGKLVIYSYSLMVVVAFCFMILYAWLEARRLKEDPEKVIDVGILMFFASFIGARILHCLVNWHIYAKDLVRIFKIWEGGMVYYGGLAGACLVATAYILWQRLNWPKWADLFAPTAMLALVFGRIGCFLNGCCYGSVAPSWLPWKVKYPSFNLPLHLAAIPLHPTPIYESTIAAIIFLFLAWRSRHKKFNGEIFWLMLILYAVARFFLEFLRGDPRGQITSIHISTSQIISLALFLLSGFFLLKNYQKPPVPEART